MKAPQTYLPTPPNPGLLPSASTHPPKGHAPRGGSCPSSIPRRPPGRTARPSPPRSQERSGPRGGGRMGVVVPEAGRAGEDGACSATGVCVCVEVGEKADREGGRRLSLRARGGGRLLRSQARPGLGPAASDAARAGCPRLPPPAYLLLGRRQLVLPAVVRHLRAGPGHVNPAGGARRSGWAGPRLLPPPGLAPPLRYCARAGRLPAGGAGLPWGQWAGGRRGGPALAAREAGLETRPAAPRRRGDEAHAPLSCPPLMAALLWLLGSFYFSFRNVCFFFLTYNDAMRKELLLFF